MGNKIETNLVSNVKQFSRLSCKVSRCEWYYRYIYIMYTIYTPLSETVEAFNTYYIYTIYNPFWDWLKLQKTLEVFEERTANTFASLSFGEMLLNCCWQLVNLHAIYIATSSIVIKWQSETKPNETKPNGNIEEQIEFLFRTTTATEATINKQTEPECCFIYTHTRTHIHSHTCMQRDKHTDIHI